MSDTDSGKITSIEIKEEFEDDSVIIEFSLDEKEKKYTGRIPKDRVPRIYTHVLIFLRSDFKNHCAEIIPDVPFEHRKFIKNHLKE